MVSYRQTVFQSGGCAILYPHQQCMRLSVSSQQVTGFPEVIILAILIGVSWHQVVLYNLHFPNKD